MIGGGPNSYELFTLGPPTSPAQDPGGQLNDSIFSLADYSGPIILCRLFCAYFLWPIILGRFDFLDAWLW